MSAEENPDECETAPKEYPTATCACDRKDGSIHRATPHRGKRDARDSVAKFPIKPRGLTPAPARTRRHHSGTHRDLGRGDIRGLPRGEVYHQSKTTEPEPNHCYGRPGPHGGSYVTLTVVDVPEIDPFWKGADPEEPWYWTPLMIAPVNDPVSV